MSFSQLSTLKFSYLYEFSQVFPLLQIISFSFSNRKVRYQKIMNLKYLIETLKLRDNVLFNCETSSFFHFWRIPFGNIFHPENDSFCIPSRRMTIRLLTSSAPTNSTRNLIFPMSPSTNRKKS